MSRREQILDEDGGGHAGSLVRLLAKGAQLDQAVVDLLAELVGRIQDSEKEIGRLKAQIGIVARRTGGPVGGDL